MKTLDAECDDNTTSKLFGDNSMMSGNELTAAFDAFCPGKCATAARNLMKSFPRCLDGEMSTTIKTALVMCEKDDNGAYCGVQTRAFDDLDCESRGTSESCTTISYCTWKGNSCELAPNKDFLDRTCSSCTHKLVNALGASSGMADQLEQALERSAS
jgi:hypothetical protein